MALQPRESVPHFDVPTIDGVRVAYGTIWQRRNLLLISLHTEGAALLRPPLLGELEGRQEQLRALATATVITDSAVEGVPAPSVVIADRWGEIYFVRGCDADTGLPDATEILDWLAYIQQECPECEGERR